MGESGNRIIRPKRADVREVWENEARDFTPWLAANIEWLSDIGLGPLDVEGVEVSVPDSGRSLDILARTADGRLVAIENQYERADHDHMTRGLAYAVGHGARALVVIAERHESEFRAIADYLNRAFEQMDDGDAIGVFLVELSVDQVDANAFVPRFDVVNAPNSWRAEVKTTAGTRVEVVASAEVFLATVDAEFRDVFSAVIDDWPTLPGAFVTRQRSTIGLRIPVPPKTGRAAHRSLYTLEKNGVVWVNTRCVAEINGLDLDEAGELIARSLEGASAPGNGTWWKIVHPQRESMMSFAAQLSG